MWRSAGSMVVSFNIDVMNAPNFCSTAEDESDIRSSGANCPRGLAVNSLRETNY